MNDAIKIVESALGWIVHHASQMAEKTEDKKTKDKINEAARLAIDATLALQAARAEAPKPELKPWQKRVVAEMDELDAKIGRLSEFLATPTFFALDKEQQKRMDRQFRVMQEYSSLLHERVETFGPELRGKCWCAPVESIA